MRYETVATFAIVDKALAAEKRDQLLAKGRMVWLELHADPELTVSVNVVEDTGQQCEPASV